MSAPTAVLSSSSSSSSSSSFSSSPSSPSLLPMSALSTSSLPSPSSLPGPGTPKRRGGGTGGAGGEKERRAATSPDRRLLSKKVDFGTPRSSRSRRIASQDTARVRNIKGVTTLRQSGKKLKEALGDLSPLTSVVKEEEEAIEEKKETKEETKEEAKEETKEEAKEQQDSTGVATDRTIELDEALRAELKRRMKVVYSVVNTFHEPIPPVGCDDYAITGNVTPGSYMQYVNLLCSKDSPMPRQYRMKSDSTFIDIGSGMGRPPMVMAALPIKASFGIELQPLCAGMSMLAMKKLYARQEKDPIGDMSYAPCFMSRGDLMTVPTLDGISHIYSFNMGMPELVQQRIVALAAWSDSAKTLTLFDRSQPAKFVRWGILEDTKGGASDCTWRLSMAMPGGHSYGMHVICLTPERRQKLRKMYPDPRLSFKGEAKKEGGRRRRGERAWESAPGHKQFTERAWGTVEKKEEEERTAVGADIIIALLLFPLASLNAPLLRLQVLGAASSIYKYTNSETVRDSIL